jgi:hypothetical protein
MENYFSSPENNCKFRIFYPAKLPFVIAGEIKKILNKQI